MAFRWCRSLVTSHTGYIATYLVQYIAWMIPKGSFCVRMAVREQPDDGCIKNGGGDNTKYRWK